MDDKTLNEFAENQAYKEMCKLSCIVSDIYVKAYSVTTIIHVLAFFNVLTCIAVWGLVIVFLMHTR